MNIKYTPYSIEFLTIFFYYHNYLNVYCVFEISDFFFDITIKTKQQQKKVCAFVAVDVF